MRIENIETIICGELLNALMNYLDGEEDLMSTYKYILDKYVDKLLWDSDNLRRYNNWFFLNINNAIEETRLDDQELGERLEALRSLSLIHVKNTYYDSTIQVRVDMEMLKAIYKMHLAHIKVDEE